jgi:hypothetical protein
MTLDEATSVRERAEQEKFRQALVREQEIRAKLARMYPNAGPVRIRMRNSGEELVIGFQHALGSLIADRAELVE